MTSAEKIARARTLSSRSWIACDDREGRADENASDARPERFGQVLRAQQHGRRLEMGRRHAAERLLAAGGYADVARAGLESAPDLRELEVRAQRLMTSGDAIAPVALQTVRLFVGPSLGGSSECSGCSGCGPSPPEPVSSLCVIHCPELRSGGLSPPLQSLPYEVLLQSLPCISHLFVSGLLRRCGRGPCFWASVSASRFGRDSDRRQRDQLAASRGPSRQGAECTGRAAGRWCPTIPGSVGRDGRGSAGDRRSSASERRRCRIPGRYESKSFDAARPVM